MLGLRIELGLGLGYDRLELSAAMQYICGGLGYV